MRDLTVRVIPCLDVAEGRVVKGVNFVDLKDAGDPVELAAFYGREGADEIVFLDITASAQKRATILEVAERTAYEVFIPFTVGGGISSVEDARKVLRAGADKVAVNTQAVYRPRLISELAEEFGSQCVVVAIDAAFAGRGAYEVVVKGGRERTGLDALKWAEEAQRLGAGELLLTSIDADGTREGYDVELLKRITTNSSVPVIASGGAGSAEHFIEAVVDGGASAVLAASLFHYRITTVREVKERLASAGIRVRPAEP